MHVADSFDHRASSGLRYIVNPPGSTARVHQHLDIGQGEVDWETFFGTLGELGFDGIMTVCVFAWEDRARESSRFMREELDRRTATGSTWRSPFFCTEASHRLRRLEHRLLPRHAHDAVGQVIRPDRVVVAREVVVVGAGAVGLDDQAAMWPAKVGLVGAERDVHERLFEAGLANEVVDVVLEDRTRSGRCRRRSRGVASTSRGLLARW